MICHGIPDYYALKDGDIVNIDISVYFNGYHGDLNETFFVGAVSEDSKRYCTSNVISTFSLLALFIYLLYILCAL